MQVRVSDVSFAWVYLCDLSRGAYKMAPGLGGR